MTFANLPFMDTSENRSRFISIGFVVLLHILIGYAFITGLAYNVVKTVSEELKTFDVAEPAPPAEAPPAEPQESVEPAPVVAPKSVVPTKAKVNAAMPSSSSSSATGSMSARWRRGSFDNDRDYPPAALRREEQGTVRVGFTIGTDGRVTSCNVLRSSGSSALDSTTCRIILSRFRYEPARDAMGNPVAETRTQPVTWRIS